MITCDPNLRLNLWKNAEEAVGIGYIGDSNDLGNVFGGIYRQAVYGCSLAFIGMGLVEEPGAGKTCSRGVCLLVAYSGRGCMVRDEPFAPPAGNTGNAGTTWWAVGFFCTWLGYAGMG